MGGKTECVLRIINSLPLGLKSLQPTNHLWWFAQAAVHVQKAEVQFIRVHQTFDEDLSCDTLATAMNHNVLMLRRV